MPKTILVTGATDGIGLETAKMLISMGHNVLLHGRSPEKLETVKRMLTALSDGGQVQSYVADLSRMADVEALSKDVAEKHTKLNVLINNAGVFTTADPTTTDGLDIRFAVNTIAPYLLTKRLLPLIESSGRVVNLSSAAQAPLDPDTLDGLSPLPDGTVYAQSKLALTKWTFHMESQKDGPVIVAVNPKSFLGTKMVKEAYGVDGADLRIGADILCRASLSFAFLSERARLLVRPPILPIILPRSPSTGRSRCMWSRTCRLRN